MTKEEVLAALKDVKDPSTGRPLGELGMLKGAEALSGSAARVQVELPTPASPHKPKLEELIRGALPQLSRVEVAFSAEVKPSLAKATNANDLVPGAKNVVLIGSGKGGVGKSTVSANLAVALAQLGAKVGLLDADIYGPSMPLMMGLFGARPVSEDGKSVMPLPAYGVKVISIGFFVDPDQAMIWRGPMLHGALVQLLRDVKWGDLDYLILDLPPGTGDIQLTIAQQVSVSGAVVVTTPQDVALSDAIKAKTMFDKVNIPVLGFVENMSGFICPHCQHETDIFSKGGAEQAAAKLHVPFLGRVPINPAIREGADDGRPVVAANPALPEAQALIRIAQNVADRVSIANMAAVPRGQKPLVQLGRKV
ncbi:MAG TPA: Mrp/NBP35 family ATP-binding protein [Myxococcales bacterium]|nr:Mrp/NBP35 family ATP-binding protein [Myxococcales bacterium]